MTDTESAAARGERLAAAGDLAGAARAFAEAIAADPSSTTALLWLARLALLAERPREARVVLARLLALEPRHPEALALHAVERLASDPEAALDGARDALAVDPRCALAWGVSAKAQLAVGDPARAAAAARRAIELAPGDFESRVTLAQAAAAEGRGHEAIDHLVAALETEPRHLRVYLALGELYAGFGRADLARRLYTEGTRHLPDVAVLRERLAALPAS
jgi:tetratricopeptide (TPR) repeat protein